VVVPAELEALTVQGTETPLVKPVTVTGDTVGVELFCVPQTTAYPVTDGKEVEPVN
jgi:hypothetical protein